MSMSVQRNTNPRPAAERDAVLTNPGFGRAFTDHMVRVDFADGVWGEPAVVPYAPLTLDPATMALHYGQLIFEGLKAYRQPDGSIATFRPEANAARFARSARRLAMAELPEQIVHRLACRAGRGRPGLDPDRRGHVAVLPAVHGRHRGGARRQQAVERVHVPADRVAGRLVLPQRGQARHRLAVDRIHARRARRDR